LFVLLGLLIISIEFEYVRIEMGKRIPLISRLWKYKRGKERDRMGGEVFFLMGAILSFAIFDLRIAAAAILMTTFGGFGCFFSWEKIRQNLCYEKSFFGGYNCRIVC